MSFKLKALYPLTGGYNRHSINQFYEESVRPTEIKGLWRWWNRVLFNTVSHANGGKLYTYDSIDRLFEDVFGSENKKSAVRLEVITDEGSDNRFELFDVELDKAIDCLKNYKGKVTVDLKDNEIVVKTENSSIPIVFKSNLDVSKIKDLVYENKLLNFDLLGFKSIDIDTTKISNENELKKILHVLAINYLEYFNINPEVEFTLNIYLDKNRENENNQSFENKLRFALYSLLVFILLGGIGRKTSRGFGSLSMIDVNCYDELCTDLESYINEILKVNDRKELKDKLIQLIHDIEYNVPFPSEEYRLEKVIFNNNNMVYYYLAPREFLENTLFIDEINPDKVEYTLNTIPEVVMKGGKCSQLIQNYLGFLVLFCGNRANEISIINNTQAIDNYLKSLGYSNCNFNLWITKYYKIFSYQSRRPSTLRFKILTINQEKTFLLTYLLIPSYIEYITDSPVNVDYKVLCKDLRTLAECVGKK